jgi:hypothetical protein
MMNTANRGKSLQGVFDRKQGLHGLNSSLNGVTTTEGRMKEQRGPVEPKEEK